MDNPCSLIKALSIRPRAPPPQPPLPFRDFEIGGEVVARVFPTGRSLRGEVQEWDFFKGALR